eukprot:Nitzschia sp. Nitz4//scaffold50_size126154//100551//101489//NITZ4_003699-RA/size126154-processed-gene-0.157-mRNA-1//1//CDS//3329553740//5884//frame0
MDEIREMRVRKIKNRLARTHGYSADELGRMLDKEELIQALSFEEHKMQQKELEAVKRYVMWRGILVAIGAIVLFAFWPLLSHLFTVAHVNFVVYYDKKLHEASKCVELRSKQGMLGVFLMGVIDLLQLWLSVSVLASWVTTSRYFFPSPKLAVRPAQFMGEKIANGPLSRYGMNVGPMAVTWVLRFLHARFEAFTGRALNQAFQQQKKEARQWESDEDRAARKAARKAEKQATKAQKEEQRAAAEREEALRRKKAAADATAALFPTPPPPVKSNENNGIEGENKQTTLRPPADSSEKEFKEQQQAMDLNGLD